MNRILEKLRALREQMDGDARDAGFPAQYRLGVSHCVRSLDKALAEVDATPQPIDSGGSGNYENLCSGCEQVFLGAIDADMCADCAYKDCTVSQQEALEALDVADSLLRDCHLREQGVDASEQEAALGALRAYVGGSPCAGVAASRERALEALVKIGDASMGDPYGDNIGDIFDEEVDALRTYINGAPCPHVPPNDCPGHKEIVGMAVNLAVAVIGAFDADDNCDRDDKETHECEAIALAYKVQDMIKAVPKPETDHE